MCLVSYVPVDGGFILSSNRDEAPYRNAVDIRHENIDGRKVTFPADTMGGSWIFVSDRSEVLCLLNGAFKPHKRLLPYKMSRGLVLKAFYDYAGAIDFFQDFNFINIEPFTLIVKTPEYFIEFRWDASIRHIRQLAEERPLVWSSCTLYDENSQRERENYFFSRLKEIPEADAGALEAIHLSNGPLDEYRGFVMNRMDLVKTISMTQVIQNKKGLTFKYMDLESDTSLTMNL